MIEYLLSPQIKSAVVRGESPPVFLYPEEAAEVRAAVDRRRQEFSTGRFCARQALRKLGLPASPILRGPNREPLWPAGVVGSIAHCAGLCAAAAALDIDMVAIGIDVEIHDELPHEILKLALTHEHAWLADAPSGVHWDRVIFSAKESVYKAWFPLAAEWLDFDDVAVRLDPAEGTFYAQLIGRSLRVSGCQVGGFAGRFMVQNGFVATAVTLSCDQLRNHLPQFRRLRR
jgi:enterobactin synthetase component D / holo-[acyl-carrier protein] synthase